MTRPSQLNLFHNYNLSPVTIDYSILESECSAKQVKREDKIIRIVDFLTDEDKKQLKIQTR